MSGWARTGGNRARSVEANVRTREYAAGIDGLDIAQTVEHLQCTWPDLRQQLSEGHHRPQPVRWVGIPKPNDDERELDIHTGPHRPLTVLPITSAGRPDSNRDMRAMSQLSSPA